ncbi:MAG: hypothetical protein KDE35_01420 [Geminicoccaceae bacterium]|nr:hypothetical protein [Geminicoccaceae bacterium]
MLKDIVAVEALPDHHLRLSFEDGVKGDIAGLVRFEGVFAASIVSPDLPSTLAAAAAPSDQWTHSGLRFLRPPS